MACGSRSLLGSCSYPPSCSRQGSRPPDWPCSPTDCQLWSREEGFVGCSVPELNRWALRNPLELLFLCTRAQRPICVLLYSQLHSLGLSLTSLAVARIPSQSYLLEVQRHLSLSPSGSKRLGKSSLGFIGTLNVPFLRFPVLTVQLLQGEDSGEQVEPLLWISQSQMSV